MDILKLKIPTNNLTNDILKIYEINKNSPGKNLNNETKYKKVKLINK
jgi:hypothetical protein